MSRRRHRRRLEPANPLGSGVQREPVCAINRSEGHVRNLEQQGELIHFTKPVDPHRNVSALSWKTYDGLGKSALFSNLDGFPGWRICGQVIADRRKWSIALGVETDALIPTLVERIGAPVEPVEIDAAAAPVKEVVRPRERGRSHEAAGGLALGTRPGTLYRLGHGDHQGSRDRDPQHVDPPDADPRPRHDRVPHLPAPRAQDLPDVPGAERADAGGDGDRRPPRALLRRRLHTRPTASTSLTVAGALLADPVRMVRCETIDMEVPAEAEIVLEGEVGPTGMTPEGPFGEASGTYAMEGSTEIFRVKAITHRQRTHVLFNAVRHSDDRHPVDHRDLYRDRGDRPSQVGRGRARPASDVRLLGISGLMAVVLKLRPRVEGQAKTALMAALSSPYLHPKLAIAVDEDIDAGDLRQVFWSLTTRVHAERDVIRIPNTRIWSLDNVSDIVPGMSPMYRIGTKTAIDATMPADNAARGRFEPAMPLNLAEVDPRDFMG